MSEHEIKNLEKLFDEIAALAPLQCTNLAGKTSLTQAITAQAASKLIEIGRASCRERV